MEAGRRGHGSRSGKPSPAELVAAYVAGVVRNHPFVDGNKRTGCMLGAGFLHPRRAACCGMVGRGAGKQPSRLSGKNGRLA